jgi:predicted TPR repeat methyltransferase
MPLQKPKVKKAPPAKNILDEIREFVDDARKTVHDWAKNWEKFRDITRNNYNLGRQHMKLGNIQDAILRFKFVVWIDPRHADAWYSLGSSYLMQGQLRQARVAFRKALKLKPANEEFAYMMALANGASTPVAELPKRIPLQLVEQHFEQLAPDYTEEQLQTYHYAGHTELCTTIRAHLTPGRIDHVILELGVGTGLCGPLMRDIAAHITGVDISAAMLAEAMKVQDAHGKKIYDALIKREIQGFLADAPAEGYDIVMAANVFSYIGDLHEIFQQVSRVLKRGGIFAFTVDKFDGHEFRFDPQDARFKFSAEYIRMLGGTHDLKSVKQDEVAIYPGYKALLCVLKK